MWLLMENVVSVFFTYLPAVNNCNAMGLLPDTDCCDICFFDIPGFWYRYVIGMDAQI